MNRGSCWAACGVLAATIVVATARASLALHPAKPAVNHTSAAEWTSVAWAGFVGDSQVAYVTQKPGQPRLLRIWDVKDGIVLSAKIVGKPHKIEQDHTIYWTTCLQGDQKSCVVQSWAPEAARTRDLMHGRLDSAHGDTLVAQDSTSPNAWQIYSLSSQSSISVTGVVRQHWATNGVGLLGVETPEKGSQLIAYSQGKLIQLADSNNGKLLKSTLSADGSVAAALFHLDKTVVAMRFDLATGDAKRWSFPDSEFSPTGTVRLVLFGTAHRLGLVQSAALPLKQQKSSPRILDWRAPELNGLPDQTVELTVLSDRVAKVALDARTEPILSPNSNHAFVMLLSDEKYVPQNEWDWPPKIDVTLHELSSGREIHVAAGIRSIPKWSNTSRYISWWNREKRTWHAFDVQHLRYIALTEGVQARFSEPQTIPALPGAIAEPRWSENDDFILIPGQSGLWSVGIQPTDQHRIGEPLPASERINWSSLRSSALKPKFYYLVSENRATQSSTVWELDSAKREARKVIELDQRVELLDLTLDGSKLLLTRERFDVFPDLWILNSDSGELTRVTELNPQQKKYRWGSPHVVTWKIDDGTILHGTLLLPDGVPKTAKAPLLVYLYEDEFRNHHVYDYPRPRSSNINPAVYVSNGYAVFLPNVSLDVGKPTLSVTESVLGGIDAVIETGYVDASRIGLQAHSFGAYLGAALITQTDRFSAAVLSAPVADLVSAYLAKRGNGSRIAQYEKGQARIGASLWEQPDLYLTQSPVLLASHIKTPVLIMANPNDDAVPSTQGLELFLALRRLSRPAWLISYRDAGHGLHDPTQRKDWADRMFQFFEYRLKDRPPPQWMNLRTKNLDGKTPPRL